MSDREADHESQCYHASIVAIMLASAATYTFSTRETTRFASGGLECYHPNIDASILTLGRWGGFCE